MAKYLEIKLLEFDFIQVLHPVELNEVFVKLPDSLVSYLNNNGVRFYQWGEETRFVTSFNTTKNHIHDLINVIKSFDALFLGRIHESARIQPALSASFR